MISDRSRERTNHLGATHGKKIMILASSFLYLYSAVAPPNASGYAFNYVVADMRQPPSQSGNSSCPIPAHFRTTAEPISRRWSTILGTTPTTILTQNQSPEARLNEIEAVIQQSFATWTGVTGTSLKSSTLAPLKRTDTQNACAADGLHSICFAQNDMSFTPGVLAFTRVIVADRIGQTLGTTTSAEIGQILDADIYFNPGDSLSIFATPAALVLQPAAYDLASVLTHELGHLFGFSHSAVWRAIMYPFAPAPGTFSGDRPTALLPDASLADDDRVGLRVLYPDSLDTSNIGRISGRVVPANPISLPLAPAGVTGLFGSHVVALDANTGAIIAGVLSGWSCEGPGPAQFDGSFRFNRLPLGAGRSYKIYAEPLNGAVDPSQVSHATATLCRNALTDAGWPAPYACVVPSTPTNFTVRVRPAP